MTGQEAHETTAHDYSDAVELCRRLVRIDTSNHGDGSGPGEREAAELVAEVLSDAGLEPELVEPTPRRTSVIARLPGADPARPALLLHGHLDVVPAPQQLWTADPFGGEIRDGFLWGRGAVDMKDMDAMILAVARQRRAEGRPPARDVVLAFFADEEAGGQQGSFWLAEHRRELFEDCTEAVSEVGGFSVTLEDQQRVYLIETARKGVAWIRATARGNAAHASLTNTENAVTHLCAAIARVGEHRWPVQLSGTSAQLIDALRDMLGTDLDPEDLDLSGTPLAPVAGLVTSSLRHTTNPTMFDAGEAFNVVPGEARAFIDGRFVPGFAEEFVSCIRELLGPGVQAELADLTSGGESPYGTDIVDAMQQALQSEDPGARTVPYCAAASTDNAAFHDAGIRGYGFAPLRLPPDFDFAAMYHGVDERVPVESVQFGARVLDRFLDLC